MSVKIQDTDKGFAALLARVARSKTYSVTIGIHGSEGSKTYEPPPREKIRQKADDKEARRFGTKHGLSKKEIAARLAAEKKQRKQEAITLAELGEIHEFGLGVPQRSFIGDWVDETEREKMDQLRGVARAVVEGTIESVEDGFEQLGNLYVAQVQKRIADGIPPPLADMTVKAKGSSTPLIDTGQLRSAITYKVKKGGK